MGTTINGETWQVTFSRDALEVIFPSEADPDWRVVDKQGHEHCWHFRQAGHGASLPSLVWKIDETYWCDSCRDEHETGHYECKKCGEEVKPGSRTPYGKQFVSGLTRCDGWFLTTRLPAGNKRFRLERFIPGHKGWAIETGVELILPGKTKKVWFTSVGKIEYMEGVK